MPATVIPNRTSFRFRKGASGLVVVERRPESARQRIVEALNWRLRWRQTVQVLRQTKSRGSSGSALTMGGTCSSASQRHPRHAAAVRDQCCAFSGSGSVTAIDRRRTLISSLSVAPSRPIDVGRYLLSASLPTADGHTRVPPVRRPEQGAGEAWALKSGRCTRSVASGGHRKESVAGTQSSALVTARHS
jgi:hypothetical protein